VIAGIIKTSFVLIQTKYHVLLIQHTKFYKKERTLQQRYSEDRKKKKPYARKKQSLQFFKTLTGYSPYYSYGKAMKKRLF
jgi:hypothetical protein